VSVVTAPETSHRCRFSRIAEGELPYFTLYSDLPFDEDIFAEAIESAAFKPHRRPSP